MYQRDYSKKIRVGIVGAGSHMYRNLLPALHYLPVELVAICNRSEERLARTIAEYRCSGYQVPAQMYENEELDAVIMAVSPYLHPDLACQALDHGLHVFMEKPAAISVAGIDQMLEASRRTGKYVVVGYKKAFMPAARKAVEIVNSGKYPGMSSILAVYPLNILPVSTTDSISVTSGSDGTANASQPPFTEWLKNSCHPLSFMLQVAGPVKSVQTLVNSQGYGSVILRFENGVIGNLHLAAGEMPAHDEYRIYGDGWSLELDCSSRITLRRGIPGFRYEYADDFAAGGEDGGNLVWEPVSCQASPENKALFVQGMVQELRYFCDCVLENRPPALGSLEFAREITEVYEAAQRSNGAEIQLR